MVMAPLTVDVAVLDLLLDAVEPGSLPLPGTQFAPALRTAIDLFPAGHDKQRVVVLLSDGEDHDEKLAPIDRPARRGRHRRAHDRRRDDAGRAGPGLGPRGRVQAHRRRRGRDQPPSARRPREARADATGGIYLEAANANADPRPILDRIQAMQKRGLSSSTVATLEERFQWPLAAAAAVLALWLAVSPYMRWPRRGSPGGRPHDAPRTRARPRPRRWRRSAPGPQRARQRTGTAPPASRASASSRSGRVVRAIDASRTALAGLRSDRSGARALSIQRPRAHRARPRRLAEGPPGRRRRAARQRAAAAAGRPARRVQRRHGASRREAARRRCAPRTGREARAARRSRQTPSTTSATRDSTPRTPAARSTPTKAPCAPSPTWPNAKRNLELALRLLEEQQRQQEQQQKDQQSDQKKNSKDQQQGGQGEGDDAQPKPDPQSQPNAGFAARPAAEPAAAGPVATGPAAAGSATAAGASAAAVPGPERHDRRTGGGDSPGGGEPRAPAAPRTGACPRPRQDQRGEGLVRAGAAAGRCSPRRGDAARPGAWAPAEEPRTEATAMLEPGVVGVEELASFTITVSSGGFGGLDVHPAFELDNFEVAAGPVPVAEPALGERHDLEHPAAHLAAAAEGCRAGARARHRAHRRGQGAATLGQGDSGAAGSAAAPGGRSGAIGDGAFDPVRGPPSAAPEPAAAGRSRPRRPGDRRSSCAPSSQPTVGLRRTADDLHPLALHPDRRRRLSAHQHAGLQGLLGARDPAAWPSSSRSGWTRTANASGASPCCAAPSFRCRREDSRSSRPKSTWSREWPRSDRSARPSGARRPFTSRPKRSRSRSRPCRPHRRTSPARWAISPSRPASTASALDSRRGCNAHDPLHRATATCRACGRRSSRSRTASRLFPPHQESAERLTDGSLVSSQEWSYVLVPQRPGTYELPALALPYFDPSAKTFRSAATRPLAAHRDRRGRRLGRRRGPPGRGDRDGCGARRHGRREDAPAVPGDPTRSAPALAGQRWTWAAGGGLLVAGLLAAGALRRNVGRGSHARNGTIARRRRYGRSSPQPRRRRRARPRPSSKKRCATTSRRASASRPVRRSRSGMPGSSQPRSIRRPPLSSPKLTRELHYLRYAPELAGRRGAARRRSGADAATRPRPALSGCTRAARHICYLSAGLLPRPERFVMSEVFSLDPHALEQFLERRRASLPHFEPEMSLADNLVEVLRKADEFVPSEAGSILLDNPRIKQVDRSRNRLTFLAAFGDKAQLLVGQTLPADEGIAGTCLSLGKGVFLDERRLGPVLQRRGGRRNAVPHPVAGGDSDPDRYRRLRRPRADQPPRSLLVQRTRTRSARDLRRLHLDLHPERPRRQAGAGGREARQPHRALQRPLPALGPGADARPLPARGDRSVAALPRSRLLQAGQRQAWASRRIAGAAREPGNSCGDRSAWRERWWRATAATSS